jgi:hypothetical protein
MANSLEYSLESFFIALLKADPRTAGKDVVHFDEEAKAKPLALVVRAQQGAKNLAGPGGYELETTIEFRSPIKTSRAENDSVAALLQSAIYDSTISISDKTAMVVAAGLSPTAFLIKDESTGDRQNTSDLRKRVVTLPCIAKLA